MFTSLVELWLSWKEEGLLLGGCVGGLGTKEPISTFFQRDHTITFGAPAKGEKVD